MKSQNYFKQLLIIVFFSALLQPKAQTLSDSLYVFAGNDTIVCLTSDSIEVMGYAENYHYVAWAHTGDGFFYNATSLKTAYVPGFEDLINKKVTLYLVGISNQNWYTQMVDSLHITIVPKPNSYAGMDATICAGHHFQLNGVVCQCSYFLWETSGDGNFVNPNELNPAYIPGNQDILNGQVLLSITAIGNEPCTQHHTDIMKLTISAAPYLNAGNDTLICEGSNVVLNAEAENFDELYWGTLGDGTFCSNYLPGTTYFPGNNDVSNGFVRLLVLIIPYEACGLYLIDSIDITIQKKPTVDAGPDQVVCETDILSCSGNAENYESLYWMVFGGNGFFENPNSANTNYHLGDHEKATGIFFINLIAVPAEPCLLPDNSFFQVEVVGSAEANAGDDVNWCFQEPLILQESSENYEMLLWQTSGDGTFSSDSLNYFYHPGEYDISQPDFFLWLTAAPVAPCNVTVSDTLVVNNGIIQNIQSDIENKEMIMGESVSLYFDVQSASPGNYSWYFNHLQIDNQTGAQLLINDISPSNAGHYYCIYENECFQISSDTALITVFAQGQQQIIFTQGWNGISSFIIPQNNNMETVLSPVIDDIIILFNEDGVFSPDMDLMTILEWLPQQGYITKTVASDTLIINGYRKYPAESVAIVPGWSIFSTGCSCTVNIEEYFSGHAYINIIKEIGGLGIYWPENNINTLENLQPGKAYHIFNASFDELMIAFPGCD